MLKSKKGLVFVIYSKKCNRKKLKAVIGWTVCFLIAIVIILNCLIIEHYEEIATQEGKKKSSEILAECISQTISDSSFNASQLVSIKYNSDGEIMYLETDADAVNKIQLEILQNVNSKLSDTNKNSSKIPFGTLTDLPFLVGEGPKLNVKFSLQGSAKVELVSEFDSGGLNQTIHKIYANIQICFFSVSPIKTENISCEFDYLICETVIVGNIPQGFSQIQRNI